ncbi:tyrosine-type recombinase/integrase [Rhodoluna sp. KAS3]|uniref:tyrosine-type recombinase/integrase n=1 Tax=Rhodoluna sp. KAS3 TaxID=942880 RepID=UPI00222F9E16|nr:tyrosine-type recombinase/integrase [Rhodoluna sp. KAS3]BDS49490.1 site-specific integrase [Rhodoluna sp. KAS3]
MVRRTSEELWQARSKPRKRGEGSVFEITVNGQRKFRATRTLYMNSDGTAVQVSGTGDSEQEAIRRRDENWKKRLVQMGELPLSALGAKPKELKMTTEEMFWAWLEWKSRQTASERRITPIVVSQYEGVIRLHIAPAFGKVPVRLVSKKIVEEFLFETLPNKRKTIKDSEGRLVETDEELIGLSKRRATQGVINMAFRWAYEEKLISENPTIGVPKIDKPISPAKDEHLEKKLWYPSYLAEKLEGQQDEARWMLMITCGLRASEKLGAEWSCFSRLTGGGLATFEVRQQLAIDPKTKRIYIKPDTKTTAGNRIIPLDKRMVKIMKNYKAIQDEWKKLPSWNPPKGLEDLVFTTPEGKPIRHQTDTKQWRSLLASLKMPFVRQHAMRHIAISSMVKLGMPIEIIRSIAGHQSEAITRATYTHLSPSAKIETITNYTDQVFKTRDKKNAEKGELAKPKSKASERKNTIEK